MLNRLAATAMACALLLQSLLPVPALAAPRAQPEIDIIAIQVGDLTLKTTATLQDGLALVPLRSFCESLGFKVSWDAPTKTATVAGAATNLSISTGAQWAILNDHRVLMRTVPRIQEGSLMVPFRFLAEALDYSVRWDSTNRAFTLKKIVSNPGLLITTVTDSVATKTLNLTIQYPKVRWGAVAIEKSINQLFSEHAALVRRDAEKYEKEAQSSPRPYKVEVFSNYTVTYNQKGFLSVLVEDYYYTGGAHGMTNRSTFNLSLFDGKVYRLRDLFAPETDYVAIISAEIKRQMPLKDLVMLTPFQAVKADQAVYLKDDGIVVYWAPYEYTPYAWGFVEFTIPPFLYRKVLSQDFQGVF